MTTRFISVDDGQKLTVSALVKDPTLIPRRILDIANNMFVADKILRPGPSLPSGVAKYFESTPMFADDDVAIVEEFGQIPVGRNSLGDVKFLRAVKRALAVLISQEMINRNDVDAVNTQINQVRNTMVKGIDDAAMGTILGNASVNTIAASAAWSSSTSKIRLDLADAIKSVADSTDANGGNFGFTPDTLVINTTAQADFLSSDDVAKVFVGNVADQNPLLLGKLGPNFFGLDVMVTRSATLAGKALVLERGTVGFISDERPLQATPLYEDRPTETWRSDTVRASAIGIDQPKAACIITGI